MSRSVFLFGPGCAPCFQSLYPRVSRYWDGSQRANCVINNRGPMQREARWVFGGRELSPSQCWIDVTELRVLQLGGACTTLRKHKYIYTKNWLAVFPQSSSGISTPNMRRLGCIYLTGSYKQFFTQTNRFPGVAAILLLLLLLMCPWARHTVSADSRDVGVQLTMSSVLARKEEMMHQFKIITNQRISLGL